jgi:hypothetical protein
MRFLYIVEYNTKFYWYTVSDVKPKLDETLPESNIAFASAY